MNWDQDNATYFGGSSSNFSDFVLLGIPESSLKTDNAECQFVTIKNSYASNISCESYINEIVNNSGNVEVSECNPEDIVFDTSVVLNSIVTEFGLTCKKAPVKNAIGSAYMVRGPP